MIEKLDSVIQSAHQWIIDKTQAEPDKAAKIMLKAACILAVVKALICVSNADWLMLVSFPIGLYCTFALYRLSSMHSFPNFWRLMLFIVAFIPHDGSARGFASFFMSMSVVSMMYFCSCEKPKPPRRKNSFESAMQ